MPPSSEDSDRLTSAIYVLTDQIIRIDRQLYEINQTLGMLERNLTSAIETAANTPMRRTMESMASRWNELLLRHMPHPPIGRSIRGTLSAPPPLGIQISAVDQYTGTQFEKLIVELLQLAGWPEVEHVGKAGGSKSKDFGVDVVARASDTVLAVQAKRYAPKTSVTSQDIQQFLGGATHHHKATALLLVTTSNKLTADAAALAATANVTIIDRPAITAWVQNGIVPDEVKEPALRARDESRAAAERLRETPPPAPRPAHLLISLCLLASMAGSALVAVYPHTRPYAIALSLLGIASAFSTWLWWRWRLHGWRAGIVSYWPKAVNKT